MKKLWWSTMEMRSSRWLSMLHFLKMRYTAWRSQPNLAANHVTERSWRSSSSLMASPMLIILTCRHPGLTEWFHKRSKIQWSVRQLLVYPLRGIAKHPCENRQSSPTQCHMTISRLRGMCIGIHERFLTAWPFHIWNWRFPKRGASNNAFTIM